MKSNDFSSIFKQSPLPIVITDGELSILWANQSAKTALPCLQLRDAFSLLIDGETRAAALRKLNFGESVQLPVTGTILSTLTLTLDPSLSGGMLENIIVRFPEKPMESNFYFLNESDLAATNFSGMYRSPIATILSLLTPLSDRYEGDPAAAEQLSLIGKNCMIMLRNTNQLTDFSRFQNGSAVLHLRYGDLCEFLRDLSASCRNFIKYTGIELLFDCTDDSCFTCFDPKYMKTVFLNLLLNSILYTRDGNLISVKLIVTGTQAQLLFHDRGAGMSESLLSRVFEPYVIDGVPRFSHSGLGLPLCKHIVTAHGGTISIHSVIHEGTTVSLSLPMHPQGDCQTLESDGDELILSDPTRPIRIALSEILPYRIP